MMLFGEGEYEVKGNMQEPQSTMSKAELRKTHKPIMEKKRRARINHCLNEIKSLILEAMNKDPARHSKLEKADILEMAVKHLQNVQRQQLAMAMASDPSVLRKFKNGFNECAVEIDQYIGKVDSVDTAMKQRVSSHLQKCINGIEQLAQLNFPGFSNLSFLSGAGVFNNTPNKLLDGGANVGDQNNNPRIQLIPSRLPTGELALLLPNSSNLPYFPAQIEPRSSAFAAVIPSHSDTKPLSPPISPREERNPSPHGFRPVLPSAKRVPINDHQIAQVSSTSTQNEVKTVKFPIHKYQEKEKKIVEPLCIITNHSERYKQAQMKEDSAGFEENLAPRGIKRTSTEPQGLLAVATNEPPLFQPVKLFKPHVEFVRGEGSAFSRPGQEDERQMEAQPGSSKETETSNDMWRPW